MINAATAVKCEDSMVTVSGGRPRPWLSSLDPELRQHIQSCPCPCDHMGYGNFLDYQVSATQSLPYLQLFMSGWIEEVEGGDRSTGN